MTDKREQELNLREQIIGWPVTVHRYCHKMYLTVDSVDEIFALFRQAGWVNSDDYYVQLSPNQALPVLYGISDDT